MTILKNSKHKYLIFFLLLALYSEAGASYKNISLGDLQDSLDACMDAKDYAAAITWGTKAVAETEKEFGQKNEEYVKSLHSISEALYYSGEYRRAIDSSLKALNIIEEIKGRDCEEYCLALNDLSFIYEQVGDYESAADFSSRALECGGREMDTNDIVYADMVSRAAYLNFIFGNMNEADELYSEHIKLIRNILPDSSAGIALRLFDCAKFYSSIAQNDSAEALFEEAIAIFKKEFSGDKKFLISKLSNIAEHYRNLNNNEYAEKYYIESLSICRTAYEGDNDILLTSINNLGMHYLDKGAFASAEPLLLEAADMGRRLYKDNKDELAIILNNLAYFYFKTGRFTLAESLYKEGLELSRDTFNKDSPELATHLNNVAVFYMQTANYKKAEPLMREALKIREFVFQSAHPDLAQSLSNMASIYKNIGQYDKAEELYQQALDMKRQIYKGIHPGIALSMNELAACLELEGEYFRADSLYSAALAMKKELYKGPHPDLALGIGNVAGFYEKYFPDMDSESMFLQSANMLMEIYKDGHPYLATAVNNLAMHYYREKNFKKAYPLIKESMNMRERLFSSMHPDLAKSYHLMALYFEAMKNFAGAEVYYKKEIEVYKKILHNYFSSLSEKEKKSFWETLRLYFEGFYSFAIERRYENPKILSDMFNYHLIAREMLFNASEKVKGRILNSGDKHLIEMHKLWQEKREMLANLYKMPESELKNSGININDIEEEINELGKYLSLRSEAFAGAFGKNFTDWVDIKNKLKKGESYVSIIRFRLKRDEDFTDTVFYAALIIDSKSIEHPRLALLENGAELEGEAIRQYRELIEKQKKKSYNTAKLKNRMKPLYKLFWKEIDEMIEERQTIFLSLDGVYHQLNLNTLVNPETNNYLIEETDIRIITSVNDLLSLDKDERKNKPSKAALFGDPQFRMSREERWAMASELNNDKKESSANRMDIPYIERSGIAPLPGTRVEIEKIGETMKSLNWNVKEFLGESAIEEALKSLDNPKVLHIATHGKFLKNIKRKKKFFNIGAADLSEHPLLRSMLFFSGAEESLSEKKTSNKSGFQVEDGILTAYEAMNLNLDSVELVTLSACETGLGAIKNGDGVYGLQKAFQIAGAKTLIMSLWTVSDKATQELMTDFYEKWLSGMSKREAFRRAQFDLKKKYPGFYYWGAFVMIGQ